MKNLKEKRGITLIALIVTIIILLILAGVSLSLVAGSNGIIEKSEKAVFEHKKAEDKEILEIAYATLYIENKTDGKEINKDTLKEELAESGKNVSVEDKQGDDNKIIVINKDTGNAYEVDKETGEIDYIGSYTGKYDDIEIKKGDIIFETSSDGEWSKEDVIVGIKVNEDIDMTNFELQVSTDGKNWEPYTGEIKLTETSTIYTKVVDKVTGQVKTTASLEVKIDKEKPTIGSISATTNKITFTATDSESGIVGYAVTTSNTEPSSWTECANTKELSKEVTGLSQNTTYYVWVKDGAGQVTVSEGVTTKPLPAVSTSDLKYTTTWNGTNATIDFTTNSGFDIEISTDGVNWEKATSKTVSTGTQIYVRYTDGTNSTEKFAAVKPILKYTIVYNMNGGNGGSTASSNHDYGTAKNLTANGFTKTGYSFAGWNTQANGSGTTYNNSQSVTNLSSTNGTTINLYAQWRINQYTITFNSNGGSACNAIKANYGAGITMPTPTRSGYTFNGWFTATSGGTRRNYTTMPAYSETVYAQWTEVRQPLEFSTVSGQGWLNNGAYYYVSSENGEGHSKVRISGLHVGDVLICKPSGGCAPVAGSSAWASITNPYGSVSYYYGSSTNFGGSEITITVTSSDLIFSVSSSGQGGACIIIVSIKDSSGNTIPIRFK